MRPLLRGCLVITAMALNTVVLSVLILLLALIRLLLPFGAARRWARKCSVSVAEFWVACNNRILDTDSRLSWETELPEKLKRDGCYIVSSNHQSWVDIFVLQRLLNRRAPFMRFFLKRELIWVPFIGPAWWALDFPFMRRYSREQLQRRPELRNRDLDAARRACEVFREVPVSMMNFLEGTRYSKSKSEQQQSPYRHLLKPRVGGLSQMLYSFGERLDGLLDCSIVYPDGVPGFWDLMCGRVQRIVVRIRQRTVPESLLGEVQGTQAGYLDDLKQWVTTMWQDKDQEIDRILHANGLAGDAGATGRQAT